MINQKLKGIAHFEELIALHATHGLYQEPVSIAEIRLRHANGGEEIRYYSLAKKQAERMSEKYVGILLNMHLCSQECYHGL
jgi:hypothetical protein